MFATILKSVPKNYNDLLSWHSQKYGQPYELLQEEECEEV